ncbi:MAG TPA: hypothetical protein VMU87_05635 [Stellaceae bacterium]|nr:hypothetical protein [Stellaceae bacterium]
MFDNTGGRIGDVAEAGGRRRKRYAPGSPDETRGPPDALSPHNAWNSTIRASKTTSQITRFWYRENGLSAPPFIRHILARSDAQCAMAPADGTDDEGYVRMPQKGRKIARPGNAVRLIHPH